MSRVAVFIDGGYLDNLLLYQYGGLKIDFSKLSSLLAGAYDHLRTYYYNCLPFAGQNPTPQDMARLEHARKFFGALTRLDRFEVREGKLKMRPGGPVQKQVDMLFGVDLVRLASKHIITHATLLTADSDFIPAIHFAKEDGIVVKLAYFLDAMPAADLIDAVDERLPLKRSDLENIKRK